MDTKKRRIGSDASDGKKRIKYQSYDVPSHKRYENNPRHKDSSYDPRHHLEHHKNYGIPGYAYPDMHNPGFNGISTLNANSQFGMHHNYDINRNHPVTAYHPNPIGNDMNQMTGFDGNPLNPLISNNPLYHADPYAQQNILNNPYPQQNYANHKPLKDEERERMIHEIILISLKLYDSLANLNQHKPTGNDPVQTKNVLKEDHMDQGDQKNVQTLSGTISNEPSKETVQEEVVHGPLSGNDGEDLSADSSTKKPMEPNLNKEGQEDKETLTSHKDETVQETIKDDQSKMDDQNTIKEIPHEALATSIEPKEDHILEDPSTKVDIPDTNDSNPSTLDEPSVPEEAPLIPSEPLFPEDPSAENIADLVMNKSNVTTIAEPEPIPKEPSAKVSLSPFMSRPF